MSKKNNKLTYLLFAVIIIALIGLAYFGLRQGTAFTIGQGFDEPASEITVSCDTSKASQIQGNFLNYQFWCENTNPPGSAKFILNKEGFNPTEVLQGLTAPCTNCGNNVLYGELSTDRYKNDDFNENGIGRTAFINNDLIVKYSAGPPQFPAWKISVKPDLFNLNIEEKTNFYQLAVNRFRLTIDSKYSSDIQGKLFLKICRLNLNTDNPECVDLSDIYTSPIIRANQVNEFEYIIPVLTPDLYTIFAKFEATSRNYGGSWNQEKSLILAQDKKDILINPPLPYYEKSDPSQVCEDIDPAYTQYDGDENLCILKVRSTEGCLSPGMSCPISVSKAYSCNLVALGKSLCQVRLYGGFCNKNENCNVNEYCNLEVNLCISKAIPEDSECSVDSDCQTFCKQNEGKVKCSSGRCDYSEAVTCEVQLLECDKYGCFANQECILKDSGEYRCENLEDVSYEDEYLEQTTVIEKVKVPIYVYIPLGIIGLFVVALILIFIFKKKK